MNVWLIDDEPFCLDELVLLIKQYPDLHLAGMDTDPLNALSSIAKCPPDVVFLDIDMPKLNGLELALRIQECCPNIIILFITAYSIYALDAYKAHPLDFLLKPIRVSRFNECITHLRKHYALLNPTCLTRIPFALHCFGPFELICDMDIKWGTRRVRDMLLFLINKNGFPTTKAELLNALFDEKNDKNTVHNMYMTIYRLKVLLGILDPDHKQILLREDYTLAIAPGICDFIDFMQFALKNAIITDRNSLGAARVLQICNAPYLENESFEWAIEIANEIEIEYERIALALTSYYIATSRIQEAKLVLTTLLLRNSLCDRAHTLLLDLTSKDGDSVAFLTRYEQYAQMLKREMHIKPALRYREQYEHFKHLNTK